MTKKYKFALLPDWQRILKQAWSIRLTLLAGLFSAAEVILPLFVDVLPRHLFVVLALCAGFWRGVLSQPCSTASLSMFVLSSSGKFRRSRPMVRLWPSQT